MSLHLEIEAILDQAKADVRKLIAEFLQDGKGLEGDVETDVSSTTHDPAVAALVDAAKAEVDTPSVPDTTSATVPPPDTPPAVSGS